MAHTKALKDFLAKYDEEKQVDPMKFEDCGGRFLHITAQTNQILFLTLEASPNLLYTH